MKYMCRSENYAAHDESNSCQVGDTVRIIECPPISKRKTWLLLERNGTMVGELPPDVAEAPVGAAVQV